MKIKNTMRIVALIAVLAIVSGTAQALDWTCATNSAPWTARGHFGSVQHNGLTWVLGGSLGPGNLANDVWFSSDMVNWTIATNAAPWSTRYVLMSIEYGGKMWVMGGGYVGTYAAYNDVWSSSDGANWTQVTNAAQWSARQGSGLVEFQGKMWLLGGVASEGGWAYKNDVWSSSDGAHWTPVTDTAPWGVRASGAAFVFDGKIWIMGGWNGSAARNDVWNSNDGVNWTQVTTNAPWVERGFFPSVVYNGRMWVLGGWNGTRLNDVWSSADGVNWNQDTNGAPWTARTGLGAAISNGKLWVLGGEVADYVYTNDVWFTTGFSPPVLWNPQVQSNQFGFNITGSSNLVIVVEACTNLANSVWSPVGTNILTSGQSYFSDPAWTNYPCCFYRFRSP